MAQATDGRHGDPGALTGEKDPEAEDPGVVQRMRVGPFASLGN